MKFQKPKSRTTDSSAAVMGMKPSMSSSSGEDEDQLPQLNCGVADSELVFMTEQLNRLRSREKRVRAAKEYLILIFLAKNCGGPIDCYGSKIDGICSKVSCAKVEGRGKSRKTQKSEESH